MSFSNFTLSQVKRDFGIATVETDILFPNVMPKVIISLAKSV